MKFKALIMDISIQMFTALGILSVIIGLIAIVGFEQLVPSIKGRSLIIVGLFIVTLVYGTIKVLHKNRITIKLNENSKMDIFYGDLLKQKGITVIPVNTHFDTLVTDKMVSPDSIHGQFIKSEFGGNIVELDRQIEQSLVKYESIRIDDSRRELGKKYKYPIGTIVEVDSTGKRYYLLAVANFDNNNKANCTCDDYKTALNKLYEYIDTFSQGKCVSIPLISSGFSRINKPKQDLLINMILQAKLSEHVFLGGINIVLYKGIKKEIGLSAVELLEKI